MMSELVLLLPEFILLGLTFALLIAEVGRFGGEIQFTRSIVVLGVSAALIHLIYLSTLPPQKIFEGKLLLDGLSLFVRTASLGIVLLSCAVERLYDEKFRESRLEFYIFMLIGAVATNIIGMSPQLVVLFLAMALFNIVLVMVCGSNRRSKKGIESAFKVLLLSSIALGIFLFGIAILYLKTSSFDLSEIRQRLEILATTEGFDRHSFLILFLLIFSSVSFYLSSFPFSFWLTDVISGTSTPAASYTSLIAPLVGISLGLRLFLSLALGAAAFEKIPWQAIVQLSAVGTFVFSAVLSTRQESIKRILGALITAQSGAFLLALAYLNNGSISALLFCWVVHMASAAGLFFTYALLKKYMKGGDLKDMAGNLKRALPETILFLGFLASMLGLPPFPSVIGRTLLFGAIVEQQQGLLGVLAVFAYLICLLSFARVCFSLTSSQDEVVTPHADSWLMRRTYLLLLLLPFLLLTLFSQSLLRLTEMSAGQIFW